MFIYLSLSHTHTVSFIALGYMIHHQIEYFPQYPHQYHNQITPLHSSPLLTPSPPPTLKLFFSPSTSSSHYKFCHSLPNIFSLPPLMSINHFSSDLPEAFWWAQPQHHHHSMEPSTKSSATTTAPTSFWGNSELYHHPIASANTMSSTFNFDLNNDDEEEIIDEQQQERENHHNLNRAEQEKEIPKEPLFEKPLTPSDVGKLNRLVIPKQHAEKYFPLNGNDSGEKGLLLSFEDELGKPWRFRYSYWNSSQSYVLTKGWSRFVKEKRLDAGDIVLFERHRLDGDRLFIGWRRRTTATAAGPVQESSGLGVAQPAVAGGSGRWTRVYFSSGHNNPYPAAQQTPPPLHHHRHSHGPALPYQPDYVHAAGGGAAITGAAAVLQNQTTATNANSKRLRLFGVNLECQQQSEELEYEAATPPEAEGSSSTSSLGQPQQAHSQFPYYPKVHHAYFNHHNHMDINFSRDANQTRYRQG